VTTSEARIVFARLTAGNRNKNLVRRPNNPLSTRILFPRLFVVSAALFFSAGAIAQSGETATRQPNTTVNVNGSLRLETQPAVVNPLEERRPRTVTPIVSRPAPIVPAIDPTNRFDQSLMTAMQSHLGSSYRFNRTGPEEFDCSGFVWRAFQEIGLNFQRGPARSYWATMAVPGPGEQFRFGNLVFFSNLSHVGIVVDEKGFYHSARHGGVMYSPFNEYWLSRIDGFRRVSPAPAVSPVAAKSSITKSAAVALAEANNQR
jgi:cell wall-associated NlpC family hydrolase